MDTLPNKKSLHYNLLKEIYATGGTFLEILAYLVCYLLGAEDYRLFYPLLFIYLVLGNVHTRIWFKSLENLPKQKGE